MTLQAGYLSFPFTVGGDGHTSRSTDELHLRGLIHQVLFTRPGERVNRPDFGCGVDQLVFAGNSGELAGATQFLIHGALTRWLDGLIEVGGVEVEAVDARLTITVRYTSRRTGEGREERFPVPGTGVTP